MNQGYEITEADWHAFREGDTSAYAVIYRRFYPGLFNYGTRFTPDPTIIEDSIQEIFTQFWIQRSQLEHIKALHSYLFVSFRHHLLKQLKKNKLPDFSSIPFELDISADQIMINAEKMYQERLRLEKAIARLTPRQKEAIFFKFYENLSYEEIASIMGISTKATYKLVARSIQELRKVYTEELNALLLSYIGALCVAQVFSA